MTDTTFYTILALAVGIVVICLITINSYMESIRQSHKKNPFIFDSENEDIDNYEDYEVEYIESVGYFPKYKGKYIYWWRTKNKYELQSHMSNALYANSNDSAIHILDNYSIQIGKLN